VIDIQLLRLKFVSSFGDSGVEGVKHVLNCISSTSHSTDALANLLVSVKNFSTQSIEYAELVVRNRALEFLQPIVVHDDLGIALSASCGICTLAAEKKFFELVDRSEALPCVQDVLRSITPGTLRAGAQWSTSDIHSLSAMMNGDAHPAVQLCALHCIGESFHQEHNQIMFSTVNMISLFRNLASSPDPFVYAAVVYLLRILHMPVPNYRAIKIEGSSDKNKIPVSDWTVEMVCQWVRLWAHFKFFDNALNEPNKSQVGSKSFRIYRHIFRDGFVNGQMLLSITNDILEQNKIVNVWHRQSILFAVGKLREASDQLSMGRTDTLGEVLIVRTYTSGSWLSSFF
jgi:hypothetical protein